MEGRGYLKNVGGLSVKEMDGKTVITAPQGAVYLGEFMTSLPAGILNKKQQGVELLRWFLRTKKM